MRLEYMNGNGKGIEFRNHRMVSRTNPVLSHNLYCSRRAGYIAVIPFIITTKQMSRNLSLQGVITLNNIRFHKAKTGVNFYVFGGIGGMTYYSQSTMH